MPEVEFLSVAGKPALQLRRLRGLGPPVLYVHGATFPAALSVGYRFGDGRSWEGALHDDGFDVWSFDFAGFGGSAPGWASKVPLAESRARCASAQIARVIEHIREVRRGAHVSLIAHSWGSIAAGCYLESSGSKVDRLIFFGPIAQRSGEKSCNLDELPRLRRITVAAQLERFTRDVPAGHATVLAEPQLAAWGPAYLASDFQAVTRDPPAVEVPGGPAADIAAAWQGELAYDPAKIEVPTLIVRGEWDSLCNDSDAEFLLDRSASDCKYDLVIPKATHLMHLETGRFALWNATSAFLQDRNLHAVLAAASHS